MTNVVALRRHDGEAAVSPRRLEAGSELAFILAGNARFTVVSGKTETRFTYRVQAADDKPGLFFVGVLTGPSNEADFSYLGTIRDGRFAHGRKSRIAPDAPSARAFAWTFGQLAEAGLQGKAAIFHEGRCGRCGRTLTVPESIESGIGPECAKRMEG